MFWSDGQDRGLGHSQLSRLDVMQNSTSPLNVSHRIHVWYINGKCYHIWHTWILWVLNSIEWPVLMNDTNVSSHLAKMAKDFDSASWGASI